MPIDKLNMHYSFTNVATSYDEEALTPLELVGRQGAKINEIIDDQNKLHDETSQALDNYENKLNNDLPAKVTQEMNRQINNGTFKREINEYTRDLEARVDNLAKLQEGSTTGDAELIGARTDHKGTTWSTLGKHLRTITKELNDNLNSMLTDDITQINAELMGGWYGIPSSNSAGWNPDTHKHIVFDVNEGETYYVACTHGWDMAGVVFFNSAGDYLNHNLYTPSASNKELYTTPIIVPEGAKRMMVQTLTDNAYNLGARKVGSPRPIYDSVYMENIIKSVTSVTPLLEDVEPVTKYLSTVIIGGQLKTSDADGYKNWVVTEYNVQRGERYRVTGTVAYDNSYYEFRDVNNELVDYIFAENMTTPSQFEIDVTIPSNAVKLMVSGNTQHNEGSIQRFKGAVSVENPMTHLKWVCLGDSLTEVNNRASKRYYDYVQDKTGINVVNMGLSGSGYMKLQEGNNAFYQRALHIPASADVVTIFGSGNDLSLTLGKPTDAGTTTVCGCINKTIENILSIHPAIKIGIVAPTPWNGNTPKDNGTMARYTEALKQIAEMHGIPFLDLFHESGLRPNDATFRTLAYSKDEGNGVHPNEIGHKMISGQFYVFIQKLVGTY